MKKNNLSRVFAILLIVLIVFSAISFTNAYSPKKFENKIDTTGNGTGDVKKVGGQIVGIIQIVGTIISVAMLIVLGIKYMTGSAEEKAEYKKTLFPYLIGAILIFAASNLAQVVYNWTVNIAKD